MNIPQDCVYVLRMRYMLAALVAAAIAFGIYRGVRALQLRRTEAAGHFSARAALVGGVANARTVACGDHHTCVVDGDQFEGDGTVWCWGDNRYGQLGDGGNQARATPAKVPGLPPISYIVAGGDHTCAMSRDKRLFCWGRGDRGQLGVAPLGNRATPVEVALKSVYSVGLGTRHTCAIVGDAVTPRIEKDVGMHREYARGNVRCWGANDKGQLGDHTRIDQATPVAVDTQLDVAQFAANGTRTAGLGPERAFVSWGDDVDHPTTFEGIGLINTIALGAEHTCITQRDGGSVWCWGANTHGQLAEWSNQPAEPFAKTPQALRDIPYPSSVVAAANGTCFAWTSARCVGENRAGQLGNASLDDSSTLHLIDGIPRDDDGELWVELGSHHGCAIQNAVTHAPQLYCWGLDDCGQLGRGGAIDPSVCAR